MSKKVTGYALGVDENKKVLPIDPEKGAASVEVPNELRKDIKKDVDNER